MLIIIVAILVIIFLLNFFIYWIIFLKTERKISNWWDIYTKIYLIIWSSSLVLIPILTSSFFEPFFGTKSYFQQLWIWFLFLGIVLVVSAITFGKLTMKINKIRGLAKGKSQLITDGPYKIMRHPMYTSWAVSFLGLAIIFDSFIALLITPFLILLLELEGFLEEKYLLIPQFGEKYENYRQKTSKRLFPTPFNVILILIAIFIVYVGIYNMFT